MLFPSNYWQADTRLITHRMVWAVALVVLSSGIGSSVEAAGCLHRTQNPSIGLDPFGNPLANNILKVYTGGEFHYYLLPQGKSCNGPNCKGLPPASMTAVPAVITSERCDLTYLANGSSIGQSHSRDTYVRWPTTRPTSPVLDGLLRPPTV